MKNKVVFIMGIGRSGSTLVELMIGSHPDCFSLGEISKLPKLLQKKKENWFAPGSTFWQDNFTQNELEELALGFSDAKASTLAVQTLIDVQGSLVVSRGLGDVKFFELALEKIENDFLGE